MSENRAAKAFAVVELLKDCLLVPGGLGIEKNAVNGSGQRSSRSSDIK